MLLELSAAVPRRRAGFVTVFVALVVLAPVIAAADVPDPTWIGGFYDGADGDELGALVWDQSPALPFDIVTLALPSPAPALDRKSTRLNSSHVAISYAVFCL